MTMSISPWMEGVTERAPALSGDAEVDVAVVGGGYTGLSTAIALREESLSVAVLEGEFAGYGASGRNAGHLTPTIGKDLPTLSLMFGRSRAGELVGLVEAAIGHVERTLEKHAIDCAYEPVGNVIAAVHPKQFGMIDRAARSGERFGADGEMLEPGEMRRRGLPRGFLRGYLERRGGILHPGRYVRGLRRAALAAGASLYEGTPVTRIEDGEPAILHTPAGRVRARRVALGTNAFTADLGLLRSAVLRIYVSLFRTAPLTPAQRDAVGWQGREGIYTAHEMLESYRLTDDGRIVGGAKVVRYGYGGRALPEDDPAGFAAIERAFRERFPELGDVAVTDRWSGPIAIALDFLPALGRTGRRGNLYYAVGYAGHGLALASYAGRMLTDVMLDREGPGQPLQTRRRIPLPPEPFRWMIFHALTGIFGARDGRVDRAVVSAAPPDRRR
jgi:glycine/D-amino acid oxidase-like deaminating enzyme